MVRGLWTLDKSAQMKTIIITPFFILIVGAGFGQLPTIENASREALLDQALIMQLDSIYQEDQQYRLKMGEIEKVHGLKSKEMQDLWKVISKKDSSNLIQLTSLLDRHGWLGPRSLETRVVQLYFL